jgi:CubicO group peptidase (beta-lactamase class C family)
MAEKISFEPFIAETMKKHLSMRSILVYREGRGTDSFYWEKWGVRWRSNIYSASKSVTSLVVGIAIGEGLLALEDRPIDSFGEYVSGTADPRLGEVTLRHLLTMSAGHEYFPSLMGSNTRDQVPHWMEHVMNIPIIRKPGEKFLYNNSAPFLCSAMLQKKAGMTMSDYLKPRLFGPLGIPNPQWLTSPEGISAGSGGLLLTPEEMLRIGQRYLGMEKWDGRQLVPEHWVREVARPQIANENWHSLIGVPEIAQTVEDADDFMAGYGYYVWMNSEGRGYRADGNGNQLIVVLPEKRAVIVTTAADSSVNLVHKAIWATVYPPVGYEISSQRLRLVSDSPAKGPLGVDGGMRIVYNTH